jgi:uncharacterized C2H2 Zn-finger protein
MKKVLSRKAPKREVIPETKRTLTPVQSQLPVRTRRSNQPNSSRNSNARSSTIVHNQSNGADMYFPRGDPHDLPSSIPSTAKSKLGKDQVPYMCPNCGKKTNKHGAYVKHLQGCSKAEGPATSEVTYMCPGCNKVYSRHETYLKHITQCMPQTDEYGT